MASARGPVGNRLSVDDWIKAGYAILAAEGMKALKIDRLCGQLGVTKGSFSWHFDGMPSYRKALVESWAELGDEDRRHIDDMGTIPPRERLSVTMTSLVGPRHWTLERAMREWARSDECGGRQRSVGRPQAAEGGAAGISGLRVRSRGGRCARHGDPAMSCSTTTPAGNWPER